VNGPLFATGCTSFGFRVVVGRVGDVRLQKLLLDQGKRNDDSVSVTLPAALFDPPIEIADVRNATADHREHIEFLVTYYKAVIEGSKEEIVEFWCPGSQTKVKEMLNDPDLAERSREGVARNPDLVVVGLVKDSGLVSVLQKRSVGVWAVTMASNQGGICLVQNPPNDLDLAIVEASFAREFAQEQ
jgi:hypothetical protein